MTQIELARDLKVGRPRKGLATLMRLQEVLRAKIETSNENRYKVDRCILAVEVLVDLAGRPLARQIGSSAWMMLVRRVNRPASSPSRGSWSRLIGDGVGSEFR
ncbi:hypothetical protein [Nocardioides zeae]|uniref:hypothetical protein n=1 Tax=Nocardioides zeae TaxID=1457234 RepID=UPI0027D7B589|nr:hypothetical protein [Nocardioides zeae]